MRPDKNPKRSEMQCETDTRECALPIQSVMSVSGSLIYRCRVFYWPFTVCWEYWYHAKSIPRTQDVLKADDLEILRGAIRGILHSSPLGVYRLPLGFYTALLNITCAPDLWSFETLRDVKKLGVTYWSAVYSDKMGYNSPLVINLKKPWWQSFKWIPVGCNLKLLQINLKNPWWQFFKWIPVGCNRKSRQIPVWPEGRVVLWISGSLSAWLSGSTGVWHSSSWTLWYKLRLRLTTSSTLWLKRFGWLNLKRYDSELIHLPGPMYLFCRLSRWSLWAAAGSIL